MDCWADGGTKTERARHGIHTYTVQHVRTASMSGYRSRASRRILTRALLEAAELVSGRTKVMIACGGGAIFFRTEGFVDPGAADPLGVGSRGIASGSLRGTVEGASFVLEGLCFSPWEPGACGRSALDVGLVFDFSVILTKSLSNRSSRSCRASRVCCVPLGTRKKARAVSATVSPPMQDKRDEAGTEENGDGDGDTKKSRTYGRKTPASRAHCCASSRLTHAEQGIFLSHLSLRRRHCVHVSGRLGFGSWR